MFNLKLLFRIGFKAWSFKRDSILRLTPKRFFALVIIFPAYLFLMAFNWFFLLLDELLFPGYRRVNIKSPVFVTALPRSATTYLARILDEDRTNFTSFPLWEIVLAPSITQKYILIGIWHADKLFGGFLKTGLTRIDRMIFKRFYHIHEISLFKPEEDEVLLLYIFSSLYLIYFFPGIDDVEIYTRFYELNEKEKRRVMNFYKRCVQRHMFVFARKDQFFVSKNPSFITKIDSLVEYFPDCKVIYIVRDPLKTIPATISLNAHLYNVFCSIPRQYPMIEKTKQVMFHWYLYALETMKKMNAARYMEVKFETLTKSPFTTIEKLYLNLGIPIGKEFRNYLKEEENRTKNYRSKHKYSLKGMNLQREEINEVLKPVYLHYGISD